VVFAFSFTAGKISAVELIADPARIRRFSLVTVTDEPKDFP
jgi:hypothetical protein